MLTGKNSINYKNYSILNLASINMTKSSCKIKFKNLNYVKKHEKGA